MTDNTKDAKITWQSLDAVMAELKLAHPEYLPLEEGKHLIPPHIRAELESSRFIKRKDKPLVLYALFSSYDYEEEPEKFLKVLKRIGLDEARKNPQIGRIILRFIQEHSNRSFGSHGEKYDRLMVIFRTMIFSSPENECLSPLLDRNSLRLYQGESYTDFMNKTLRGTAPRGTNEVADAFFKETARAFADTIVINLHPHPSETLLKVRDFTIDESGRFRNPYLVSEILKTLNEAMDHVYESMPIEARGLLSDLIGELEHAQMTDPSAEFMRYCEEIGRRLSALRKIAFR